MTDKEIVVFNDKSWVRFTEYQKVMEENEQLKEHCDELELINQKVMEENERLEEQNEKMKLVETCRKKKIYKFNKGCCDKWEQKE